MISIICVLQEAGNTKYIHSYNNEYYLFSAVMQQMQAKNIIRIRVAFISSLLSNDI